MEYADESASQAVDANEVSRGHLGDPSSWLRHADRLFGIVALNGRL